MLSTCADFVRIAPMWVFWLVALGLGYAAATCFYFGFSSLYRSRLVADMPTSRLRSAAQGYTELEGRAAMIPGEPIYAPLSGMPCVWYSYSVEQTARDTSGSGGWLTVESGVSDAIFHLVDDTGVCIVDPDGAEATPSVKLCWRGDAPRPLYTPKSTGFWSRFFSFGAYRYTECRIHDHDPLYAMGQFIGMGDFESASIVEAARDLLATWKRDRVGLLRRFDGDGDGEIDMDEWENARQAAEREAIATWRERRTQPEMNLLKKPGQGRPFILSCISQDQAIAGHRRKGLSGILGFFALGLMLAWMIEKRFGQI